MNISFPLSIVEAKTMGRPDTERSWVGFVAPPKSTRVPQVDGEVQRNTEMQSVVV
jgi:hypothetical protein